MSKFTEYIGSQFGNPRGIVGKVCCLIMNAINRQMYKWTIVLAKVSVGEKVLDIGYGNGYLLRLMDRLYSPDMYGIDISEDMLIQATRRNKRAARDNRLHLSIGDCCALPYDSDFFSAVTSVNTIYFWSDPVKGLTEILRCLKITVIPTLLGAGIRLFENAKQEIQLRLLNTQSYNGMTDLIYTRR